MPNILLTGRPGIGKTTLIKRVLGSIGGVMRIGGFYTQEIRENNVRFGFKILTVNGNEGVLAHIHLKSKFKVGKYGINLLNMDEIGVKSILEALNYDLIIIDEIGSMELYSNKFKAVVTNALDTGMVFGTISRKRDLFIDKIRKRDDTEIIEVTLDNRNSLVDILTEKIASSRFRFK